MYLCVKKRIGCVCAYIVISIYGRLGKNQLRAPLWEESTHRLELGGYLLFIE